MGRLDSTENLMPRPCCRRTVAGAPHCGVFKPAGVPASALKEVVLMLDELEAVRLADLEGLYQEEAAQRMKVSRQTFGRIVEAGRRKIAQALIEGKALKIEGGVIEMVATRMFTCGDCGRQWTCPHGAGRPAGCPECRSKNIHRAASDRGPCGAPGRGGHCRRGRTGQE